MTYRQAVSALRLAGIEDAETEAAILSEQFGKIPTHTLPFCMDEDISAPLFLDAVSRRIRREPLQYIIGRWWFCGLELEINRDCLCPRPDTELIVELAVKHLPKGAVFCDIGTGSGAIALSILHLRPDTRVVAVDISEGALSMATKNAERLSLGDRFTPVLADILAPTLHPYLASLDAIISNPPYIPSGELEALSPEVRREPQRALDGGEDGLLFYRELTKKAQHIIKNDGFILYEIGKGQHTALKKIADELGYSFTAECDLSGILRAVLLKKQPDQ